MQSWMEDQDAAWWAKIRRANAHLETLVRLVAEFRATKPYTLEPEPGDMPDVLAVPAAHSC
jgi:hypothetical protein